MITQETIEIAKQRLVKAYNPLAIYLFGSYAWGTPDEESDLDLMIVVSDEAELERPESLKGHDVLIDLRVPVDILINKESTFLKRANHLSTLQHKIKNEAVKLYGNT
ncbi:MAG: nucleotidyltransferase domain-containing protein [Thermoflexibacter sp.]|jgi:predicted nucleotidyltransferase|nr:nucleotidyltransferase domain-containing protein [Thermoflexibacter sp.]